MFLASVAAFGLLVPSICLNIFWIVVAVTVCDKGLDKRSIDQAVLAIHLCLPLQAARLWCSDTAEPLLCTRLAQSSAPCEGKV